MQAIKNLHSADLPQGLHGRIMKKIFFLKFRMPFFLVIALSIINLINSGWHLLNKVWEMQTFNIFSAMIQQFELNFDYGKSLLSTVLENTPVGLLAAFIVNLALVYYLINIFKYFKRSNQSLLY